MMMQTTFRDIFIDPISLETMTDPVINTCGHTFERLQIEGWHANRIAAGAVSGCPLCREPIGNLVPNILLKGTIDIITNPENLRLNHIEDLTDEESEQVQQAINSIRERRAADQAIGILDRLPESQNFITKFAGAVSNFYCGK